MGRAASGALFSRPQRMPTGCPDYLGPLLETMKGVYEQLTRAIRQVETTLKQRERSDERVGRLEAFPE
jgi:hypothetical protein